MKYRLNKGSTISKASVRHKSSKISCNRIEIAALQWSNVGLELLQSCCTSNPNPSKIQAPCNVPTLATQPNPTHDEGDDDGDSGDGDDGDGDDGDGADFDGDVLMWMMVMICFQSP